MTQQYVIMRIDGTAKPFEPVPAFYGNVSGGSGSASVFRRGDLRHTAPRVAKQSAEAQRKLIAESWFLQSQLALRGPLVIVEHDSNLTIELGVAGARANAVVQEAVTVTVAGTATAYATAAEFARALRMGEIAGLRVVQEISG